MAAHRHWRIYVTSGHSVNLYARRIKFRNTPGSGDLTGSGTPYAGYSDPSRGPERAFTDNNDSWDATIQTIDGASTAWIAYDFGAGNEVDVSEFTWTTSLANCNPKDGLLEYSDDGVLWVPYAFFKGMAAKGPSDIDVPFTLGVNLILYSTISLDSHAQANKVSSQVVVAAFGDAGQSAIDVEYQAFLHAPGMAVDSALHQVVLESRDAAEIVDTTTLVAWEPHDEARVMGLTGYAVFRLIPTPTRKTHVIVTRGIGFGGSGVENPLSGKITQAVNFNTKLNIPIDMVGRLSQHSEVSARVNVDNGTVEQFLNGPLVQETHFSSILYLPHSLAGSLTQESVTSADLYVNSNVQDHFLEAALEQESTTQGNLTVLLAVKATYSFTITIPPQEETLTNFPVRLDFDTFPPHFWEVVRPNTIRVFAADDETELAVDVIDLNRNERYGNLFFRAPELSTTESTTFILKVLGHPAAIDPTGPLGREAVWQDYDFFAAFQDMINRVSGTPLTLNSDFRAYSYVAGIAQKVVIPAKHLSYNTLFGRWLAVEQEALQVYDASWAPLPLRKTLAEVNAATGATTTMLSGGYVSEGEWFVLSQRTAPYPTGHQYISVWDADTLAFKRSYNISGNEHLASGMVIIGDVVYVIDSRREAMEIIHRYNKNTGAYLGPLTTSRPFYKKAIEVDNGQLIILAEDNFLYKVDPVTGLSFVAWQSREVQLEGAQISGLVRDNLGLNAAYGDVMLALARTPYQSDIRPGWAKMDGGDWALIAVPTYATWTMGGSFVADTSGTRGILTYGPTTSGAATNTRTSLTTRSGSIGLWNSTNGWLQPPAGIGTEPSVEAHANARHDAAASLRYITRNRSTASGAAAIRPTGNDSSIYIGATGEGSEVFIGSIQYAYLRGEFMSTAWVNAEELSWLRPESFYTITPRSSEGYIRG
jgi:hypothetical protein